MMSVKPFISQDSQLYLQENINGYLFLSVDVVSKTSLLLFMIMAMGFDLDLLWTIKQPLNRYEQRWKVLYKLCFWISIIFAPYLVLTSNPFGTQMKIGMMHKYYHWEFLNAVILFEAIVMIVTVFVSFFILSKNKNGWNQEIK